MFEWLRFALSALLLAGGLFFHFVSILGVFRFRYVLNRLHAAAMLDTLGFFLCAASLVVAFGVSLATLKLLTAVVFMWISVPLSSHLIARLQVMLEANPRDHMEVETMEEEEDA